MRVQAEGLRVQIGGAEILRGVSLEAKSGEFVGIIGPNGSGKSTLLKCLCRVLQPVRGSVSIGGAALASMTYRESAKRVAVVAQHAPAGFDFTALEMALLGRAPHKRGLERDGARDYEIARAAMETVGLAGLEERTFSTLSGGERQRVLLAQALTQQTPCLLLDEPTNHLDIHHQLRLMEIVKSLGVTVIAAIHDLNLAAAYCDRLYVLRDGEMAASGAAGDVLTRALIRDVYGVDAEILRSRAGGNHIAFSKIVEF
ncbi:MAG: ABC transporter ATP-binding protein [Clostridiales bacterium]|jgi:iron complex transport system ATP-binding protein|nr:ABC transporter ATP-binding protein [Clostridiales bacterium]